LVCWNKKYALSVPMYPAVNGLSIKKSKGKSQRKGLWGIVRGRLSWGEKGEQVGWSLEEKKKKGQGVKVGSLRDGFLSYFSIEGGNGGEGKAGGLF